MNIREFDELLGIKICNTMWEWNEHEFLIQVMEIYMIDFMKA